MSYVVHRVTVEFIPVDRLMFHFTNPRTTPSKDNTIKILDNPDVTISAFTSVDNVPVTMMFRDGMVTSVPQESPGSVCKVSHATESVKAQPCIYIVKQYKLYSTTEASRQHMIDYYTNRSDNIVYQGEAAREILTNVLGEQHRFHVIDTYATLVIKVPLTELRAAGDLYIPEFDVTLIYGEIHSGVTGPNRGIDIPQIDPNTVAYEYFHSGSSLNKYVKAGKTIMRLRPSTITDQPELVRITYAYNTGEREVIEVLPEDFEEHGIFDSREKCEANGDMDNMVKLKQFEMTESKLQHTERESKHAIKKHKLEIDTLKHKYEQLTAHYKAEAKKREDQLECLELKYKNERTHAERMREIEIADSDMRREEAEAQRKHEDKRRADEHERALHKYRLEIEALTAKHKEESKKREAEFKALKIKVKGERESREAAINKIKMEHKHSLEVLTKQNEKLKTTLIHETHVRAHEVRMMRIKELSKLHDLTINEIKAALESKMKKEKHNMEMRKMKYENNSKASLSGLGLATGLAKAVL